MRKALLIILSAIMLFSCEYFYSEKANAKLYMIAMGIGYKHTTSISTLDYTSSDAAAVSEQIRNIVDGRMDYEIYTYTDTENGFEVSLMASTGDKDVYLKFETNPSLNEISELFEDILGSSGEEDLIIFYYAGHGVEDTGDLVYSYEYNSGSYNTISVRTMLDDDGLLSPYSARKLIILDSCYSGVFIEEGDLASTNTYKEKTIKDDDYSYLEFYNLIKSVKLSFETLNSSNSAMPEAYVLSASSADQMAYEASSLEHGYFTYSLLSYLDYDLAEDEATHTSKFNNRTVSVTDLYNGVINAFPSTSYYKIATPTMTPSRYDMILFDFR